MFSHAVWVDAGQMMCRAKRTLISSTQFGILACADAQHPLPSPSMSSPDGPPSPMKEKVDLAKEKAGERSTPASRAGRDLQRAPKP